MSPFPGGGGGNGPIGGPPRPQQQQQQQLPPGMYGMHAAQKPGPGGPMPGGPMPGGPMPGGPMSGGPMSGGPMSGSGPPGMHPGQMQPGGLGGHGKIYPPNQPMVFNPSNPNAPPIYPCGVCHKEIHDNDQAILCESGCNFWFHRTCTGLTDVAYVMLTKEVYAEWVCDKCLQTRNIPLVKMKP